MNDKIEFTPLQEEDERKVRIKAKAPNLRDLMQKVSIGITQSENPKWRHLEYYDLETYPADSSYHMGRIGNSSFILNNGDVNLSFLRAVTLDEGIEITLNTMNVDWNSVARTTMKAIEDFIRRHQVARINWEIEKEGTSVESDSKNIVPIHSIPQPTPSRSHRIKTIRIGVGDQDQKDQASSRRDQARRDQYGETTDTTDATIEFIHQDTIGDALA